MSLVLTVVWGLLALASYLLAEQRHRREVRAGRTGYSTTVRVVLATPFVLALLVLALDLTA